MKDLKLEITYMPLDQLTPYENNAKLHPKEQIEKIENSIKEFGMNDPIAICGKDNIIVEGHGRLLACRELGIKTVPVIRLDHLNDEQRRAYTLAHNQLTMDTGFDINILQNEIQNITLDMGDFGFDMEALNFEEPEKIVEDEVPEVEEHAESKLGEIYILGGHKLMCGDATKIEDIQKLVGGGVLN